MIGTIRINFIAGAIAFIFTFLLSVAHNIWMTTFIRSIYSFLVLFLLVFLVRWVLGSVAGMKQIEVKNDEGQELETLKGHAVDASTPDETAALHQMLKQGSVLEDADGMLEFAPLKPPKLSTKVNTNPEELAQALRRMTEE